MVITAERVLSPLRMPVIAGEATPAGSKVKSKSAVRRKSAGLNNLMTKNIIKGSTTSWRITIKKRSLILFSCFAICVTSIPINVKKSIVISRNVRYGLNIANCGKISPKTMPDADIAAEFFSIKFATLFICHIIKYSYKKFNS